MVNSSVVVSKSDLANFRRPRIFFGCDRGGAYRPPKNKSQEPRQENVKNTGTKKCGCPFKITAQKHHSGDDSWELTVNNGRHNHELSAYLDGHSYLGRLDPEQKQLFKDLTKGSVRPKEAQPLCLRATKRSCTNTATYNIFQKVQKVSRNWMGCSPKESQWCIQPNFQGQIPDKWCRRSHSAIPNGLWIRRPDEEQEEVGFGRCFERHLNFLLIPLCKWKM